MLKKIEKKIKQQMATPAPLQQYQFHIDVVSADMISGWALNKNAKQTPVKIEVFSGSTLLWQTVADIAREDLAAAGFGDSAFALVPNASVLTANIDHVDVYIDGHKVNEQAYPLALNAPSVDDYTCYVDAVDNDKVIGWCRHVNQADRRVVVELKHNDDVLAHGVADVFREDLQQANIGDGHYGFSLSLNKANFPAEVVSCNVYLDGLLSQTEPVELKISTQEIEKAKFLAKFANELGDFQQLVAVEATRIAEQIESATPTNEQTSMNTVVNVVVHNIAELSARMNVLEKVLTAHFGK
ncbi:hypothetical protein [Pseudoalteromonas sp. NCIMB_1079]|uniref:hypothetical protein n=1 Tax=Pseudoalteromonas sp. NCIMB 1079 TaxID=3142847 RepID=UPI00339CC3F4